MGNFFLFLKKKIFCGFQVFLKFYIWAGCLLAFIINLFFHYLLFSLLTYSLTISYTYTIILEAYSSFFYTPLTSNNPTLLPTPL